MVKNFDHFSDRGYLVSIKHFYIATRRPLDRQHSYEHSLINILFVTLKMRKLTIFMQGGANTAPKALNISAGLLVATGETWKTGRQALTPSFSGMKMKLVCINRYIIEHKGLIDTM